MHPSVEKGEKKGKKTSPASEVLFFDFMAHFLLSGVAWIDFHFRLVGSEPHG